MSTPSDISPLSRLLMRIDAAADGTDGPDGIPTGFPSLDERLGGGLRTGDLTVLGGDVGSGKSSLALAMALRASTAGWPVMFLSGEMSSQRVLERVLAMEGRARIDDLRRGKVSEEVRAALGAAAVRLREGLPIIDQLPENPGEMTALHYSGSDRKLLVVDSLQCLTGSQLPFHEEIAAAIVQLKAMAVREEVAVLVTAHLSSRAPQSDARPTLDDFGGMGIVKQLADVVLALHREELYDQGRTGEGATELHVLKNRNGPAGYVDLYFYGQWLRFEDMIEP